MVKYPNAALPISASKVLVVGLAAAAWAASDGGGGINLHLDAVLASPIATAALLWTGLFTTAGALALETEAFKWVPATDVTIILATEPLMAAGLAYAALSESFGVTDAIGGALVISACVLNEVQISHEALAPAVVSLDDTECILIRLPELSAAADWWVCPEARADGESCREVYSDGEIVVACAY